ncbi:MAG: hypothetical protein FWD02_02255 [Bacteroidales bacterium]|nr:hypothetical protein [Bacteroidales bacterium]
MNSVSPVRKYTRNLLITGAVLMVVSSLAQHFWSENMYPLWPILLLFIIGVQWLLFGFISKFAQHKPATLLKQYQIAKYAKMFIYMVVLAIYVFAIRTNAMAFLLNFILYYLVFTVLETWFVQRWMNALPRTPEKKVQTSSEASETPNPNTQEEQK